jgi:arylformamidase
MKIFDISMALKSKTVVFPGDPPFKLEKTATIHEDKLNLSRLIVGAHTGTHVDSPYHFIEHGSNITDLPLSNYLGKAKVIDLTEIPFGKGISAEILENYKFSREDIILLKTKNSSLPHEGDFFKNFIYLTPEAAKYLVKQGIKAVGIDYLSIEKFDNKNADTHLILLQNNILIFEGLVLLEIPEGTYFFVGLPLKAIGIEGSPIRAVLIKGLADFS